MLCLAHIIVVINCLESMVCLNFKLPFYKWGLFKHFKESNPILLKNVCVTNLLIIWWYFYKCHVLYFLFGLFLHSIGKGLGA